MVDRPIPRGLSLVSLSVALICVLTVPAIAENETDVKFRIGGTGGVYWTPDLKSFFPHHKYRWILAPTAG